jgi:uncharacterized protein
LPRPQCRRMIGRMPGCRLFKPSGPSGPAPEEVTVSLDELEALRLADYEGLYQEEAAERMKVSRQTFGRIIESARRKVASALVEVKALRIEGGEIEIPGQEAFTCLECRHGWSLPSGGAENRPRGCPACGGMAVPSDFKAAACCESAPSGRCRHHRKRVPAVKIEKQETPTDS